MTVELYDKPNLVEILQVCMGMQQDEQEQFKAFYGTDYEPYTFAAQIATAPGPKWMLSVGLRPIAICGYQQVRPGVYQDWFISTPDAWEPSAVRGVTKQCRRIMDHMLKNGAHRLQCISLQGRIKAHRWYHALGLELEGPLEGYGANGEDMFMFKRVKKKT